MRRGADLLLLLSEWPELKKIDLRNQKRQWPAP
jgi:hypothetical protein